MEYKREGFWKCRAEPNLPLPVLGYKKWDNYDLFLAKLKWLESSEETKSVLYRGFSVCRLCGCVNGSKEYRNKEWIWPSGYFHYLNMHFIEPSKEFYDFVMGEQ